jgi:hypothetical protein
MQYRLSQKWPLRAKETTKARIEQTRPCRIKRPRQINGGKTQTFLNQADHIIRSDQVEQTRSDKRNQIVRRAIKPK